jgi:competence protein ComEC
MRRQTIIIGCILLCIVLAAREWRLRPDGTLRVDVLDVGQGDAILLTSPTGMQVLVDGGPDDAVLRQLGAVMPFLDRTIELVILTHPDADHVNGLVPVFERYGVDRLLLSGVVKEQTMYRRLLELAAQQRTQILIADPTHDLMFPDGLLLDVVWPPPGTAGSSPSAANDTSVMVKASFGSGSILLTGDVSDKVEKALLAANVNLQSTVLKMPHHGSKYSSSTGFLLAVDPDYALVSAGRDNRYGHPTPEALGRYAALGIPVRSTINEGWMTVRLQ